MHWVILYCNVSKNIIFAAAFVCASFKRTKKYRERRNQHRSKIEIEIEIKSKIKNAQQLINYKFVSYQFIIRSIP